MRGKMPWISITILFGLIHLCVTEIPEVRFLSKPGSGIRRITSAMPSITLPYTTLNSTARLSVALSKTKSSKVKLPRASTIGKTKTSKYVQPTDTCNLENPAKEHINKYLVNMKLSDICQPMTMNDRSLNIKIGPANPSDVNSLAGTHSSEPDFPGIPREDNNGIYDTVKVVSPEIKLEEFYNPIISRFKRSVDKTELQRTLEGVNVIGVTKPRKGEPKGVIVVGARWTNNTLSTDDNGSGLTVLIKVAEYLRKLGCKLSSTVIFVSYFDARAGENPLLGSQAFIRDYLNPKYLDKGTPFLGAFNLDRLMNYNTKPNSQKIPASFKKVPKVEHLIRGKNNKANFVAIINRKREDRMLSSTFMDNYKRLRKPLVGAYDFAIKAPDSDSGKLKPDDKFFVQSDHYSYWQNNLTSIHIFDTGSQRDGGNRTDKYGTLKIDDISLDMMKKISNAVILSILDIGEYSKKDGRPCYDVTDTEMTTILMETTPIVIETTPVVIETTPVVIETTPVVVETTPVVVETTPVVIETTTINAAKARTGIYLPYFEKHVRELLNITITNKTDSDIKAYVENLIQQDFADLDINHVGQRESYDETDNGKQVHSRSLENLIGQMRGKNYGKPEDKIVVIGAHYDLASRSKGVDWNLSGVGLALTVAKAIKDSKKMFNNTISIVFFDGGVKGNYGSLMYIHHYLERKFLEKCDCVVRGVFMLDGVLNYDTRNNTQTIDPNWVVDNSEAVNLIEKNGKKGDFVGLLYRKSLDDELVREFEIEWNNLGQENFKLVALDAGRDAPNSWKKKKVKDQFSKGDHTNFWKSHDYKAICITDTVELRGRMRNCTNKPCDDAKMLSSVDTAFTTKIGDALLKTVMKLAVELVDKV